MKLFTGDYLSRSSCENCCFKGYSRQSDITLGDFWGIWDVAPEMDDDRGTSVILLHSEKGRQACDQIKDKLRIKEVRLEQASQSNPSMISPSKAKESREKALEAIREEGFEKAIPLLSSPRSKWRRAAGKLIRVIRKG